MNGLNEKSVSFLSLFNIQTSLKRIESRHIFTSQNVRAIHILTIFLFEIKRNFLIFSFITESKSLLEVRLAPEMFLHIFVSTVLNNSIT